MKYLLVLLLSGCALIPSKFDSQLYNHLVVLVVAVERAQQSCGDTSFVEKAAVVDYMSKIVVKYTENRDQDVHPIIVIIDKDITELLTQYTSKGYCEMSMEIIDSELKALLTGVGEKK